MFAAPVCDERNQQHKNVLMLSNTQYGNIQEHLQKEQDAQEELQMELRYKDYLREGSNEIKKRWKQPKKEEKKLVSRRHHVMTQVEIQNMKKHILGLKSDQLEMRDKFLADMEKVIKRNRDGPKSLTSALVESHTMHEREAQVKMKMQIQEQNKNIEAEYVASMRADVAQYVSEIMEKDRIKRKQFNDWRKDVQAQSDILRKINEEEAEKELQAALEDNRLADKEIKELKDKEKELAKRNREIVLQNAAESVQAALDKKKKEETLEEAEDKLVSVFAEGKRRLECMRKEKTKKMLNDRLKSREELGRKIYEKIKPDYGPEEESYIRDKAAIDARMVKRLEASKKKEQEAREKRKKNYEEEMAELEKKTKEMLDIQSWEMLNRYKNQEITEECQRRRELRRQEVMLKNKNNLDAQVEENAKRNAREKRLQEEIKKNLDLVIKYEDDDFLEYANEVLEESRKAGRPLFPIHKAIQFYKKKNELSDEIPLPRHLISKVPINQKPPLRTGK